MEEEKEDLCYHRWYHYLEDERHVQLFDTDRKRVLDDACLDERRCGYDLVHVTKKWHRFSSCLDDNSHNHSEEEEEVVEHTILEGCSSDHSHQSWNYHCIRCEV